MFKDKQKTVRFSPKSSIRSSSSADKENSKPAPRRRQREIDSDESAVDSLTTNAASPPQSSGDEVEVKPTHTANCFSEDRSDHKLEPNPDKPSLHDPHCGADNIPCPCYPEFNHAFIQTIVNPTEKVVPSPAPLREFPPSLNDLIGELEVENFGKELRNVNIDEMFSPRDDGEWRELTERLHSYIRRMRDLRSGAPDLDSQNFFKSVEAMETQMKNLKVTYEKEITKLRQQLDDLSSQKHHLQLQNGKLEATASDLQIRMTAEADKSRRLIEEMRGLHVTLQQKEDEFRSSLQQVLNDKSELTDVDDINRKLDQTLRENMDLHRRYESELLQRRENEEKVHQLQEQINFNEEVNKQQQQDLQDRLASASAAIISLEGKMHTFQGRPEQEIDVREMIVSIREAAEKELQRYKLESEKMFSESVAMITSKMEDDKKEFEVVLEENQRLLAVVEELNAQIRRLQGELANVEHMNRATEENTVIEKKRTTAQIKAMADRLKELQDMLVDKTKELSEVKIMSVPLKTEIESLKALIAEEEKRMDMEMSLPPISRTVKESSFAAAAAGRSSDCVFCPPAYGADYSTDYGVGIPSEITDGIGSLYTTAPNTRAMQVEPAAQLETARSVSPSGRPVGPVRPKSCRARAAQGDTTECLEVGNKAETRSVDIPTDFSRPKPSSVTSHDYNHCTSSATGDIRVHEVSPDGKNICLINMSSEKEIDVGGYTLQQQVGGSPVAVYRFPLNTKFAPKSYITVYSGCNDPILHQPPTQFVWKEQERWGTGPECTTIVCKPNGQAIAWTTAAHRFGSGMGNGSSVRTDSPPTAPELPVFTKNPNAPPNEPLFLKREKEMPPSLAAQKHPHGNVYREVHSEFNEKRVRDLGNDNSSNNRQTRSQSAVPDRVSGEPYAGTIGQRMGSCTMRRFTPLHGKSGNIRKNGAITNRVDGNIRFGSISPFNSPHQQEFMRAIENKSTTLTTNVHFVQ